jgi:hypothetical protein
MDTANKAQVSIFRGLHQGIGQEDNCKTKVATIDVPAGIPEPTCKLVGQVVVKLPRVCQLKFREGVGRICNVASVVPDLQAALAHHPQHALAVDFHVLLALQPPGHTAIAIGRLFAAGGSDQLVAPAIGTTAVRPLPVVEA